MKSFSCVILLGALVAGACAGPLAKDKSERITPKQTVEEFFTSNWGSCEPLKNPLVLPEISDAATWERCRAHIPISPEQVEEALPNLSRCMLKVIGWVRPNGNMNLTKYMDYLSQAGLDGKTLELTKMAHEKCSQRALTQAVNDYKEQDKIYVECIFKHFDKTCPPNFQAAVKQGYIVGITQISFVPRYDEVEEAVAEDEAEYAGQAEQPSKTSDAQQ
jgi:hypothetical protein